MAFKKKLYRYRPGSEQAIEVRTTQKRTKPVPCDPRSIEHGVRQFLADKVMGNLAGVWLLVPELLRLGAWDLVCGWTGQSPQSVGPRLALQLIHEAALCRTGLRHRRTLNQRIFELANGLPFLASDIAIHELLGARSVADSLRFQVALGKIRRASSHFRGRLLAIDPHRVRSFTKRHMRLHRDDAPDFRLHGTIWLCNVRCYAWPRPLWSTDETCRLVLPSIPPTIAHSVNSSGLRSWVPGFQSSVQ